MQPGSEGGAAHHCPRWATGRKAGRPARPGGGVGVEVLEAVSRTGMDGRQRSDSCARVPGHVTGCGPEDTSPQSRGHQKKLELSGNKDNLWMAAGVRAAA